MTFEEAFRQLPAIAILRGVKPGEAVAIAEALVEAGVRVIEIPLNSPDPLTSIKRVADALSAETVIGAGTVVRPAEVAAVAEVGGQIIVSPNCDAAVIEMTKARGLVSLPGVMTPSEAFSALGAGADVLKLFPGEFFALPIIKALWAVLPRTSRLVLVGGVTAETVGQFSGTPIAGFGVGSSLYQPGLRPHEVMARGQKLVEAMRRAGFGEP